MKAKVLRLLREAKDSFVSGQELCEKLQVSRTAVWKVIQELKAEGYQIEAVRNKGYRIVESPVDILNASEIKSRLNGGQIGTEIYYKDEIDSTNNWLRQLALAGAPSGTIALADRQNSGKGRRGRVWESPSGSSLYMSLLLRPELLPSQVSMLTLVMGLSVAQALKKMTGLNAGIKWPNDVVVNGRKICGILTEMSGQMDYVESLVIGVGINVNRDEFPGELADIATSVSLQLGHVVSRSEIAAEVFRCFEKNYEIFLATGDLTGLREDYESILVSKDCEVRVSGFGGDFTGRALGINDQGELLVEKEDHEIKEVFAGEVSVRGINGYV